jgi:hypothetical protein
VSPDNRGNSDKTSSLPTRKYEPTQNTFNEILTKLVKGRSYAGIFDCWSSKSCQAIVGMPETASSNGQDIRYTLLAPNFFAKYILTLKKDPRHWSGILELLKGIASLLYE